MNPNCLPLQHNQPYRCGRFWRWTLSLMLCLLTCLAGEAAARPSPRPLPGEADLVPDRLLVFVHGYLSSAAPMKTYIDLFSRLGVPTRFDVDEQVSTLRYHAHAFDYSHFSRPGSDQNLSVEELAHSFGEFYHALPESCPVCRRRADKPVKVTLIAHSFGGLVLREFLLNEVRPRTLASTAITQGLQTSDAWHVDRVITTGTPYFGSTKTRFTQGFLSVLINGLIRTTLLGFVRPDGGGVFGNTIDAQATAVRLGSPYLWEAQQRWSRLDTHLRAHSESIPPWLVIVGVGQDRPEGTGDGVVRFSAANLAPLFPHSPVETLVVNLDHAAMVRIKPRGSRQREQRQMVAAMHHFITTGTLADAPPGLVSRYGLTVGQDGDHLMPEAQLLRSFNPDEPGFVRQWFYTPDPDPIEKLEVRDFLQRLKRVERVVAADGADVWMRFYAGLPNAKRPPQVLALPRPLSFFQNGIERSRDWTDRVATVEQNEAGELIPIVQSLAPERSHLISIPDLRPAGAFRLWIRLEDGIELTASEVRVEVEGGMASLPWQDPVRSGIPVWIRPQQANLVHIYLDAVRILESHPQLHRLQIREVALEPEERPTRPRRKVRDGTLREVSSRDGKAKPLAGK